MTTDDKPAPAPGTATLDPGVRALLWHIAAEVLPGEYCDAEVAPGGIAEAANKILDRFKRLDAAGKAKGG